MKVARLGGPFILFEFKDKAEAEKNVVLRRSFCNWRGGTQKRGVFEKVSKLMKYG